MLRGVSATRDYAARLVKEGITVNAIAPSLIETDMMRAAATRWLRVSRCLGYP